MEVMKFDKPQQASHLKPLYIKDHMNGRPISRVLIDGGPIMNVMLIGILKKLVKTQKDVKEINIKMTNFTKESK